MKLIKDIKKKITNVKLQGQALSQVQNIISFTNAMQKEMKESIDELQYYINNIQDLQEDGKHKHLMIHYKKIVKIYEKIFLSQVKEIIDIGKKNEK